MVTIRVMARLGKSRKEINNRVEEQLKRSSSVVLKISHAADSSSKYCLLISYTNITCWFFINISPADFYKHLTCWFCFNIWHSADSSSVNFLQILLHQGTACSWGILTSRTFPLHILPTLHSALALLPAGQSTLAVALHKNWRIKKGTFHGKI